MNTTIKNKSLSLPCRTQPTWSIVHLKYLSLITIHLGIATCRQPSNDNSVTAFTLHERFHPKDYEKVST